ncbi:MAG: hypothetical protein AB7D00_03660 [Rhodospirillaceae bacterium]
MLAESIGSWIMMLAESIGSWIMMLAESIGSWTMMLAESIGSWTMMLAESIGSWIMMLAESAGSWIDRHGAFAAWIQAVGSIAAIIFSGLQGKEAFIRQNRRDLYAESCRRRAICDALASELRVLVRLLEDWRVVEVYRGMTDKIDGGVRPLGVEQFPFGDNMTPVFEANCAEIGILSPFLASEVVTTYANLRGAFDLLRHDCSHLRAEIDTAPKDDVVKGMRARVLRMENLLPRVHGTAEKLEAYARTLDVPPPEFFTNNMRPHE